MSNFEQWLEENYDELNTRCSEEGKLDDNPDFDFDTWALSIFESEKED